MTSAIDANPLIKDRKIMKLWKLSLTAAVAALVVVAAGPVARANPFVLDGTYAFTATDGNNALNGSTVTFLNDVIVNWNLVDSLAPTGSDLPLTPSNSSFIGFGSAVIGPDEWYFSIGSNTVAASFFEGDNNLEGPGVPGGGLGRLYDGYGDPSGTWGPARTSVPDASDTFQLFAGALTALGACRYLLFRQAATRS